MDKAKEKNRAHLRRHRRVRKKIFGTGTRPRLSVFKSNRGIYAQIVNDDESITLVSASTIDTELRDKVKGLPKKDGAAQVGALVAARAIKQNIKEVVFDRGGNLYHGNVKELADAARKAGLKF